MYLSSISSTNFLPPTPNQFLETICFLKSLETERLKILISLTIRNIDEIFVVGIISNHFIKYDYTTKTPKIVIIIVVMAIIFTN